jgi:hypothetical protein
VLVVHKYIHRNTYFTIMAPVEYLQNLLTVRGEIRQPIDAKCAKYFRRINRSYSNCRVCKSFAGLSSRFILILLFFWQGCEGLADSGPDRTVRQAGPGERPARDQSGALDDARHGGAEEVGS